MLKCIVPLLAFSIFYSIPGIGQADYRLYRYTDENGLPQNSVKAIARDRHGFIWLTTEDGLVRFDGTRFSRYGKEQLGVSTNRFRSFYKVPGNETLFACSDVFDRIRIENGRAYMDQSPGSIPADSALWVNPQSAADKGFEVLSSLPVPFKNWKYQPSRIRVCTSAGNYFLYERDTLNYVSGGVRLSQPVAPERMSWNFIRLDESLYVIDLRTKNVQVFGQNAGTGSLQGAIRENPAFHGNTSLSLFWNTWNPDHAVIYLDGVFYLVRPGPSRTLVTTTIFTGFDAADHHITTAFYDEQEKSLYLGSSVQGLFILKPSLFRTLSEHVNGNSFYAQVEYEPGQILTAHGYLLGIDGSKSRVRALSERKMQDYYSLVRRRSGELWLRGNFLLYRIHPDQPSRLDAWEMPQPISLLYESRDGAIWVGQRGGALDRFYPDTDERPRPWVTVKDAITCVAEVGDSLVLIGTESGLFKMSLPEKEIQVVPGMQQKFIRSLYAPAANEIWVTTYEDGFFLQTGQQTIAFPKDARNYLSSAHCLVEDDQGFFWIPTNKGLFRAKKTDLLHYAATGKVEPRYYYFDRQDGLLTNEFNGGCQPCAIKLTNGYISLPSMNGFVLFHPDSVVQTEQNAAIFLDELQVDGRVTDTVLLQHLSPETRQLSFRVSTPYMGNPANNQLLYALVSNGRPAVWTPVPAEGQITFSSLPAGEHWLRLRKQNGPTANAWSERAIRIYVMPRWYQRAWFHGLVSLLAAGLVYAFIRLRLRLIRKKNQQLQDMVQEQTIALSHQLYLQEKLIQVIGHDIRTPLRYISLLSRRLAEEAQKQEASALHAQASVIQESSDRLQHMIANLVSYLRVQGGQRDIPKEYFSLHQLTEEKWLLFRGMARENKVTLVNSIAPSLQAFGSPVLIGVILHNLIDNAVKVTREGRVEVGAERQNQDIRLWIKDTGPGLRPRLAEWLSTPPQDKNEKITADPELSFGIGLLVVKELAYLLGVAIEVEARPHGGTCISLVISEQ